MIVTIVAYPAGKRPCKLGNASRDLPRLLKPVAFGRPKTNHTTVKLHKLHFKISEHFTNFALFPPHAALRPLEADITLAMNHDLLG